MKIEKIIPAVKDYIWGGDKLTEFNIGKKGQITAEAWMLSLHADGMSTLVDGTPLSEVVKKSDLGKNCDKFDFFPVLIKLICAKENLSVQVHPDDTYALKNEGQYGKTEMWYVLDAEEGAGLYVGFKKNITLPDYKAAIENGDILNHLNFFKVKKGECYFIPSGTVHAIGKGCVICEVQQNSNLTYRVFDYNRKDKFGNGRELHIDKALKVTDLNPYAPIKFDNGFLADCKYFTSRILKASNPVIVGQDDSFTSIIVLNGSGKIDSKPAVKGDSYFIPAGQKCEITSDDTNFEVMETFIR